MAYRLEDINFKTIADPAGFAAECDAAYQEKVVHAADMICDNRKNSPIILLSGPSGSGKTTTAHKVVEELERRGIRTHYVGMDDYYNNYDPKTSPKTPEGDPDYESPYCLDIELLNRHFTDLSEGRAIQIPSYDFASSTRRAEPSDEICLGKDEMVVFEGIHGLNDMFTLRHPEAFKLHIAANSDVEFHGKVVFKRTWFRLVRRLVRDYNFRGAGPDETMGMWANVRRGEKLYITPFKNKANFQFDTSLAFELAAMNTTATKLLSSVPEGIERFDELRSILPAIQLFGHIEDKDIAADSLIREFIGPKQS